MINIFCSNIKKLYPQYFKQCLVLDYGCSKIEKDLFEQCVIFNIKDTFNEMSEVYDTIISIDSLEHEPFIESTLFNIERLLKPKGLFILNHVQNIDEKSIKKCFPIDDFFSTYSFSETNVGITFSKKISNIVDNLVLYCKVSRNSSPNSLKFLINSVNLSNIPLSLIPKLNYPIYHI